MAALTTFRSLPEDLQSYVLLQSWQLLDQIHRYGIFPLVNRHWLSLVLSKPQHQLQLQPTHHSFLQSFLSWVLKHRITLNFPHISINGSSLRYSAPNLLDDLIRVTSSTSSLQSLSLSAFHFGSLGDQLSSLTNLMYLSLQDWGEDYICTPLPGLFALTFLKHLELTSSSSDETSDPWITPTLPTLQRLTHLRLSGFPLESKDLTPFLTLQNLRKLHLDSTTFSLKDLPHISSIPFASISLEVPSDDAAAFQFSSYLHHASRSLEALSLKAALPARMPLFGQQEQPLYLSPGMVSLLLSPLKAAVDLQEIRLHRCNLSTAASSEGSSSSAELASLTQLSSLCLSSCTLTAEGVSNLASLLHLKRLELLVSAQESCCAQARSLQHLASSLTQLTSFRIPYWPSKHLSPSSLTAATQLQELQLPFGTAAAALTHLTGLSMLRVLQAEGLQVADAASEASGMAALACLASLQQLRCCGCSRRFGAHAVLMLTKLKQLTCLEVDMEGFGHAPLMPEVGGLAA